MSAIDSVDVIDLCDLETDPKDQVLEWHVQVQNLLISYETKYTSMDFENMVHDYHKCLKLIDDFKDNTTLDVTMTSHIEFIYSYMKELRFDSLIFSETSNYLEIILMKFIEVKINLYEERARRLDDDVRKKLLDDLKKMQKRDKGKDRKRNILKNFVQRSLYYLQLFFGGKETSILHVFIGISHKKYGIDGKEFLAMLINIYLSKWPPRDLSDEGFMRGYLIFHKMKEFFPKHRHEDIDRNLYKLYKRTPGQIENILMPAFNNTMDLMLHISNPSEALTKIYFNYLNKQNDKIVFNDKFLNKVSNNFLESSAIVNEYVNLFGDNYVKEDKEIGDDVNLNDRPNMELDAEQNIVNEVSDQMKESNITDAATDDDDVVIITDPQEEDCKSPIQEKNDKRTEEMSTQKKVEKLMENISKIDLNNIKLPPLPRPPDFLPSVASPFLRQPPVTLSPTHNAENHFNSEILPTTANLNNVLVDSNLDDSHVNSYENDVADITEYGNNMTTASVLSPIDNTLQFANETTENERQKDEPLTSTTLDTNEKIQLVLPKTVYQNTSTGGQISPDSRNVLLGNTNDLQINDNNMVVSNNNDWNSQSQFIISDVTSLRDTPSVNIFSSIVNDKIESVINTRKSFMYKYNINDPSQTKVGSEAQPKVSTTSKSPTNNQQLEESLEKSVNNSDAASLIRSSKEKIVEKRNSPQVQCQAVETTTPSDSDLCDHDNIDIDEHHLSPSSTFTVVEASGSIKPLNNVRVNNYSADFFVDANGVMTGPLEVGKNPASAEVEEHLSEEYFEDEQGSHISDLPDPELEPDNESYYIEDDRSSHLSNLPNCELEPNNVDGNIEEQQSSHLSNLPISQLEPVNEYEYIDHEQSSHLVNLPTSQLENHNEDEYIDDEQSSHSPEYPSPEFEPYNGNACNKPGQSYRILAENSSPSGIDVDCERAITPTIPCASSSSIVPPELKPRFESLILGKNIELKINLDTFECYGVQLDDEKLTEKTMKIKNDKISASQMKYFYDINKLSRENCDKKYKDELSRELITKVRKNIPIKVLTKGEEIHFRSFSRFIERFRKSFSKTDAKSFEIHFFNCLCDLEYANKFKVFNSSKSKRQNCLFKFNLKSNLTTESLEHTTGVEEAHQVIVNEKDQDFSSEINYYEEDKINNNKKRKPCIPTRSKIRKDSGNFKEYNNESTDDTKKIKKNTKQLKELQKQSGNKRKRTIENTGVNNKKNVQNTNKGRALKSIYQKKCLSKSQNNKITKSSEESSTNVENSEMLPLNDHTFSYGSHENTVIPFVYSSVPILSPEIVEKPTDIHFNYTKISFDKNSNVSSCRQKSSNLQPAVDETKIMCETMMKKPITNATFSNTDFLKNDIISTNSTNNRLSRINSHPTVNQLELISNSSQITNDVCDTSNKAISNEIVRKNSLNDISVNEVSLPLKKRKRSPKNENQIDTLKIPQQKFVESCQLEEKNKYVITKMSQKQHFQLNNKMEEDIISQDMKAFQESSISLDIYNTYPSAPTVLQESNITEKPFKSNIPSKHKKPLTENYYPTAKTISFAEYINNIDTNCQRVKTRAERKQYVPENENLYYSCPVKGNNQLCPNLAHTISPLSSQQCSAQWPLEISNLLPTNGNYFSGNSSFDLTIPIKGQQTYPPMYTDSEHVNYIDQQLIVKKETRRYISSKKKN